MKEDISDVSRVLSLSKDEASILLRYFNWSVSKVNDVWFVDEFEIREKLGLLEKPVVVHQNDSASVGQDMIDSLVSEEDKKIGRSILSSWLSLILKRMGAQNGVLAQDVSHRPLDCETVKKWVLKNTSESENMNYILAYCKPCPNCSMSSKLSQGSYGKQVYVTFQLGLFLMFTSLPHPKLSKIVNLNP
ncbi:hypothetical protein GH714_014680 [Hevea brasiliensis]|uniref:E3 ubiquitin-protein ligase ARIH1-like UBA-like domain-containing protein n=1 Tax=Hevea brasiliensis TaxID=3981 RepID=A0A6A6NH65_HEVBR|nr:hypothetical protein GH714_014680 [Hevea brasiliensis]